MKVAVIATHGQPIPPFKGYGGTQRGIYDFLNFFPKRGDGNEIYLMAPGNSDVRSLAGVKLIPTIEVSSGDASTPQTPQWREHEGERHNAVVLEAVQRLASSGEIDVINSRIGDTDFVRKLLDLNLGLPIVTSLHNANTTSIERKVEELKSLEGVHFVAHCLNHKAQHGDLENIHVILYGIDVSSYQFSGFTLTQTPEEPTLPMLQDLKRRGRDYFVHVSRIDLSKGQKTAIELVLSGTGDDIIIAGTPLNFLVNSNMVPSQYFQRQVEPLFSNERVHYFGNADEEQKQELLRYAKGFVFPTGFEDRTFKEPFGRAPVEALSCGVPVLAFNYGSMPEIIRPGENGFLFQDEREALSFVGELKDLSRAAARQSAVSRFDARRVAEEYHALFTELIR